METTSLKYIEIKNKQNGDIEKNSNLKSKNV